MRAFSLLLNWLRVTVSSLIFFFSSVPLCLSITSLTTRGRISSVPRLSKQEWCRARWCQHSSITTRSASLILQTFVLLCSTPLFKSLENIEERQGFGQNSQTKLSRSFHFQEPAVIFNCGCGWTRNRQPLDPSWLLQFLCSRCAWVINTWTF